ncbi:MAG: hypothetical protein A3B75_03380 [Candidatus Terrybacteria bacterium RIFCSPHIGHO2_02_FULL_43_14]|nr:MAG: hypothetical protein A3B75_03380 [Candidatus Terrybacteria bacterium RIFCSPHIGHO2_02_FULL_43_14]
MKTTVKLIAITVVISATVFFPANNVNASHAMAEVSIINQNGAEEFQIAIRSAKTNLPLANAIVTLRADESFLGVTGKVELGRTVTDQDGMAVIKPHPMPSGKHIVYITYETQDKAQPETITITVSTSNTTSQLYRSEDGISIPGLNIALLLMIVLSVVWGILLTVALRLVAIARNGSDVAPTNKGTKYYQRK